MTFRDLTPLFEPRSVAIVGASDDPGRIGGRPLKYMQNSGFTGRLIPVNPKYDTVQSLPAVRSLADADGEIDAIVVAVAERFVPETLRQAAEKGTRAAVIFSSGYAEVGEDGAAKQAALVEEAERLGIRVLGPNCLGLYVAQSGMCGTFASLFERSMPPRGPLAIVSQSGAYGTHIGLIARERGLGISHMVTTGNEADVSVADCIAHFARDPAVEVIACYSEGLKDGRAFLAAAEEARAAGKPVVILKVGRTAEGQSAAQSHTASVAGDDRVFTELAANAGVLRVDTTEELMEAAYTLSRSKPLGGRRVGVMSVSGGACVLMADAARHAGLELPEMPADAQARLAEVIPMGAVRNPIDTTGNAINDMSIVSTALSEMLGAGNHDAVTGFFLNWPASPTVGARLREAIAKGRAGHEGVTLALATNAAAHRDEFEAAGILIYEDPSHTMRALGRSAWVGEALAGPARSAPAAGRTVEIPVRIDEAEGAAILTEAGVAMAEVHVAKTPDEAAALAQRLDGPAAVKILSPDILHKSDIGGVRLGVEGAEGLRRAATDILDNARGRAPEAELRGVLVAPMVSGGVELILGARVDATFGPVVAIGLGGVFVEIFEDVVIAAAPVSADAVRQLLPRLKGFALLTGARGRAPADLDALAQTIERFSAFFAANAETLASAEINPLLALPDRAVGLDAAFERA